MPQQVALGEDEGAVSVWGAIVPSGSEETFEIGGSTFLFDFTWPSPRSKNVCQPI